MMHARHRNPGNGYRSGPVGMGMGMGASRVSPDGSTRGQSFFNPEYRSFNNRGFGRGQGPPKSFQHASQPLQRKGDILMEAGRLAAEYLVSKGLLPQNTLPGKWQNGGLKKQVGDYQDFRLQEDVLPEGRAPAQARLGSSASDVGVGRRKYADDFNSRNHGQGRRRGEYYRRSNNSEWGREYGRSGSWSDRSRVSPDNEGEDDTFSGNFEEQQTSEDIGNRIQKSGVSGSAPESDEAADMESGVEHNNSDEMGSKVSTSSFEKDGTDKQPSKASDAVTDCNLGNEDGNRDHETDKEIVPKDSTIQTVESHLSEKHGSDLLALCKFAKVPTRTRSALTYRVPKVNQVLNTEEVKTSEIGSPKVSEVSVQDSSVEFSAANLLPNTNDLEFHDPEISKEVPEQSAYEVGELGSAYGDVQGKCMRSQSFPNRFYMPNEQELSQGVPSFGRSVSIKERGEKRVAEDSNMNDTTKRPREWLPSLIGTTSDHLPLSNLSQNQESARGAMASSVEQDMVAVVQDSLVNSHQFSEPGDDPCAEYPQEKQLYPSSFKICDLNLMEASDMNDSHSNDQILMYPSMTARKTEAAQIDVDLSISNSNLSGEYTRCTGNGNGKNIEVIDLENDSTEEDKAFDNSQTKEDDFIGPEGFPNRAQNAGDIADAQDNYDGLLSEYLTTFSSCSSVAEDINPLQNEIGLHNGEGALGDDDSIYMSLGEIPLSFIPAWEQPTPNEYGKPF